MIASSKKKSFDLPSEGTGEFDGCSSDSDSEESPTFYRHRKLTAAKMKSKVSWERRIDRVDVLLWFEGAALNLYSISRWNYISV